MLLNLIATIINFFISGSGSFFTWKSYREARIARDEAKLAASETAAAKEEALHAIEVYKLFAAQQELYQRMENCDRIITSAQTPLSSNPEFSRDFSFIIAMLERLLDPSGQEINLLKEIKRDYENLQKVESNPDENRATYAALLGQTRAILKIGRS